MSKGDKDGWKRGCKGIDGHEYVELNRAKDYEKRGISPVSFGEPMGKPDRSGLLSGKDVGSAEKTWKPASIREGRDSNRAKGKDYGTSPNIKGDAAVGKYKSWGIQKYMVK